MMMPLLKQVFNQTLDERREEQCRRFAQACTKNPKTQKMLPLNPNMISTRNHEKYNVQYARTSRIKYSAIPYMQRLLNSSL